MIIKPSYNQKLRNTLPANTHIFIHEIFNSKEKNDLKISKAKSESCDEY